MTLLRCPILLPVLLPLSCALQAAENLPVNRNALEQIQALKSNQGALLGNARVVGDFNNVARRFNLHQTGPRRRDYSLKMVWAPDRQRALFLGANHGSPHRLNDVWEFDLGAMSWILLYAPDNPRSHLGLGDDPSDVVFADGVLMTRRGGPAVIGHTWSGITYDPEHRRLLFMNTWLTKVEEAIMQVGGDPATRYRGPPLWSFDPASRRWKLIRTPEGGPRAPFGAMLEYADDLGGAIWHMNNWRMQATWLYDTTKQNWTQLPVNQEKKDFKIEAPKAELVGYYDPRRKIIVSQQDKDTFHFDIARRAWKKVIDRPADAVDVPRGHDARTGFYFDNASGHGLLVDFRDYELWAYDPDAKSWASLRPAGDPMPKGDKQLAYVDPAHNVLVVISDTLVWAYRYAQPSAGKRPGG